MTTHTAAPATDPTAPWTVTAALDHRARHDAEREALVDGDRRLTYAELRTEVRTTVAALRRAGLAPGDRVVLHGANAWQVAVVELACYCSGIVAVPLSARLTAVELERLFTPIRPALYVGSRATRDAADPALAAYVAADRRIHYDAPAGAPDGWDRFVDGVEPARWPAESDPDAPVLLLPTSGTTGAPKLVVHSSRTLRAQAASWVSIGLRPGDRAFGAVPLAHISGVYHLVACVFSGSTLVLQTRFDATAALDLLAAERCTYAAGLPFMLAALLQVQQQDPRPLPSLQTATVAGDTCPPDVQAGFAAAFGVRPLPFWASTEVTGGTGIGHGEGPVTSVMPWTEVRLDDRGVDADAGELLIRSACLSPGYWDGRGAVVPFPDGWFATGDRFVRQGDELRFVGRIKDLVVRGGSNVSPAEVENELRPLPGVHDVAVFGLPHPVLGQQVAAAFVVEPGWSWERHRAEAATRLAAYMLPERVFVVDHLDRNQNGKVDRGALARELTGHPPA